METRSLPDPSSSDRSVSDRSVPDRCARSVSPQIICGKYLPTIQSAAILVLFFVVAFVCSPRISAQTLNPDSQKNTVRGIVINAMTHEPVGRALVTSPGGRWAMLTDAEGHFEFALPDQTDGSQIAPSGPGQARRTRSGAGGPLWLTARKPGFLDRPNEAGQVQAIPGSEVTISLMPEALIKGRVILSTGDAALNVGVQIFSRQVQDGALRWLQSGQTRANSNGEFRFAELSPGAYKVMTNELMDNDPADTVAGGQLYGFAPVYYPGVADFASAGTIQLTPGQTVEADLSITRQPYYPVRIPVPSGDVNGEMKVTVSVQGRRGPEYSLGYNAGKQSIEGLLPNGTYLVEATKFGQNSATGAVNIAVAGGPVESSALTLTRTSSVRLQVTEEFSDANSNKSGPASGGARSYLQVRAESADDFAAQSNASLRPPTGPNDESLVIENLSPGRYWLRLSSSRGYVASAVMGGIDLLRQPFVVASASSTPIEITMRDDNAQIEGTVADVSTLPTANPGAPAQQAYVYCVPLIDSPGQFQQFHVSAEGKFSSQAMTPGTYRVMAFRNPQNNLPYRDADSMRAYDSLGQVVHLGAGQKTSVQLQISSVGE